MSGNPGPGTSIRTISTVPIFAQFVALLLFLGFATLAAIGTWATLRRPY